MHALGLPCCCWGGEVSAGAFCASKPADPNSVSLREPQSKAARDAVGRPSGEPQLSITAARAVASDAADALAAQPPKPP
jgi:hypothetical protein